MSSEWNAGLESVEERTNVKQWELSHTTFQLTLQTTTLQGEKYLNNILKIKIANDILNITWEGHWPKLWDLLDHQMVGQVPITSYRLHTNFESTILLDDISDHLPTVALVCQTMVKDKIPLIFRSKNLTDVKKALINESLTKPDWLSILNGNNSNENFNKFNETLNKVMEEISSGWVENKKCLQRGS